MDQEMAFKLLEYIEQLIFDNDNNTQINSGKDVCLANALYLYFIILQKYKTGNTCNVVYKGLSHRSYEVVLSTLNYLLILHGNVDLESNFQDHLSIIVYKNVLEKLHDDKQYIRLLCNVLKQNTYLECTQKTLRVLTLEKDTEKYIVDTKKSKNNTTISGTYTIISDDVILNTLINCIQNEHENFTHLYLESLSNFVTKKLKDSGLSDSRILDVIKIIFACSSSDNNDSTRSVVVGFLEKNLELLMELKCDSLNIEDKCEYLDCRVICTT